jgi:hypothetical protein
MLPVEVAGLFAVPKATLLDRRGASAALTTRGVPCPQREAAGRRVDDHVAGEPTSVPLTRASSKQRAGSLVVQEPQATSHPPRSHGLDTTLLRDSSGPLA